MNVHFLFHLQPYVTTAFGRNALSASQDLDRIQDRADKTSSELRRTEAELRVTRVSEFHVEYFSTKSDVDVELFSLFNVSWLINVHWLETIFVFVLLQLFAKWIRKEEGEQRPHFCEEYKP